MTVNSSNAWVDEVRKHWGEGNSHGVVVVVDGPQDGDPKATKAAIITRITDMSLMFRIPLTKQEVMNLSRALLESVT